MKRVSSAGLNRKEEPAARGFTLVELLVVILIIGMLMALLFPALTAVKNAVNKARAKEKMVALMGATVAYKNDYSRLPRPRNATELVLIFNGLRDPITVQDVDSLLKENPRKIKYLEFAAKEVTVPGAAGKSGPLYDPWGVPYAYCFDNGTGGEYFQGSDSAQETVPWRDEAAYDHIVPAPFAISGKPNRIDAECAFFSNGPDRRTGTGPSDHRSTSGSAAYEDDVRSW
ncbi:MAG: type II secretion system protein [Verrucomicrobia bacterium]|nr:type II secretion system protein [Verrucomicrobiota bacterium]